MTRPRWAFGAAVLVVTAAMLSSAPRASVQAQEESCPPARFGAQLLTPLTGRHPRDAAMVVRLVPGGSLTALPPLMLTRRRREIATATEAIAPGLYRVRADTRRIYGRYRLEGAGCALVCSGLLRIRRLATRNQQGQGDKAHQFAQFHNFLGQ